MTIKMPRNLMTAISVVAFAVLLNGCGGGSDSSPVTTAPPDDTTPPTMIVGATVPSGTTITLPADHGLPNTTISAATDETITVPGFGTFTCVSADGCSATVAGDELTSTGDIEVVSLDVTDAGVLTQLAAAVAEPDPDAEPTALETVQADAVTAATAAATAATAAKTATEAALAARENRAVIQTGDLSGSNSGVSAHSAYMQAKAAADAATAAQTASDAAAAATDVGAATRALVMAENAQDDAETAQGLAETHRDAAVLAAGKEVKVVDTTKSVGDTSITIDGTASSRTVNSVTTHTGLVNATEGLAINTDGRRDANGRLLVNEDGQPADGVGVGVTPTIAFTYDSADDSARVTLVHSYLGSEKQMQFVRVGDDDSPFTDVEVPTREDIPVVDGKIDHDGVDQTDAVAPTPAGSDFVSAAVTAETATLYYVDTGVEDMTTGDTDDGIDQTKMFFERDINRGVTTYSEVNVIQVTVDNATGFKHLHYGLWNGLSGTDVNKIADLGIGFVAQYGEAGMTQDMPNFGEATYNGNWVANIQAADEEGDGAISRQAGEASVVADFVKNDVDVTLSGLAMLEGKIDGNTFDGEGKPTLLPDENMALPGGLANAELMGSFSGAFFGPKAAEAGGVFDYSSADNEDGAFRGSFGGTR